MIGWPPERASGSQYISFFLRFLFLWCKEAVHFMFFSWEGCGAHRCMVYLTPFPKWNLKKEGIFRLIYFGVEWSANDEASKDAGGSISNSSNPLELCARQYDLVYTSGAEKTIPTSRFIRYIYAGFGCFSKIRSINWFIIWSVSHISFWLWNIRDIVTFDIKLPYY